MMKKFLLVAAIITMSCGACKKQANFDEQIAANARERTAKYCPQPVAEGVMIDSMVYMAEEHTLNYYYSMDDSVYTVENLKAGEAEFREKMKNDIRNSLDLKAVKEHGVNLRYVYLSKTDGELMLEELFTKEDYR